MEKRFRTREISDSWVYTVAEAAEVIDGSQRTIRNWIRNNRLVLFIATKPYGILGADLKACVLERRASKKTILGEVDFYCFRCKCARSPKNGRVLSCIGKGPSWRMVGICEICGCKMNRSIRVADLPVWDTVFFVRKDEPQSTT